MELIRLQLVPLGRFTSSVITSFVHRRYYSYLSNCSLLTNLYNSYPAYVSFCNCLHLCDHQTRVCLVSIPYQFDYKTDAISLKTIDPKKVVQKVQKIKRLIRATTIKKLPRILSAPCHISSRNFFVTKYVIPVLVIIPRTRQSKKSSIISHYQSNSNKHTYDNTNKKNYQTVLSF